MPTRRAITRFIGAGAALALMTPLEPANDNNRPAPDGGGSKITVDERALVNFIAESEGTAGQPDDGYSTSLDYGLWLPGGKEQDLASLTLDQVDALQKGMLAHRANIARYGGSSAMGRYQIVRRTLTGLRAELGLRGNELFDRAMQDRLALHLARKRSASKGLGLEWASLKGRKLDKAIKLAEKAFGETRSRSSRR